jgi:hypothetical protein
LTTPPSQEPCDIAISFYKKRKRKANIENDLEDMIDYKESL